MPIPGTSFTFVQTEGRQYPQSSARWSEAYQWPDPERYDTTGLYNHNDELLWSMGLPGHPANFEFSRDGVHSAWISGSLDNNHPALLFLYRGAYIAQYCAADLLDTRALNRLPSCARSIGFTQVDRQTNELVLTTLERDKIRFDMTTGKITNRTSYPAAVGWVAVYLLMAFLASAILSLGTSWCAWHATADERPRLG